ncbi:MAG: T9SS type A sorting domain-containing protein [Candidatus Kapabacteria bacterium]|jgi:hypothetical protein|nr:T9SS type A sorting domain-containing protein [Candidatus Kapabacteria bacterium]
MRVLKVLFFLVLFSMQFQTAEAQTQKEHLIAWWNFDDSTATDFSGNGYHGTMMNNPKPVEGIKGIGTALRFEGKNDFIPNGGDPAKIGDHILIPTIDLKNIPGFTTCMWVKQDYLTAYYGEGYLWFGNHNVGWFGIMNHVDQSSSSTKLYINYAVGANTENIAPLAYEYDPAKNNDVWMFLCFTYHQGKIKGYFNGKYFGAINQEVNISQAEAAIARHWWSGRSSARFTGEIDDVRIYNIYLEDDQIDSIYKEYDTFLKIQGSDFCEGESTELVATEGFDSYKWSTGETTRIITVDAEGTYTVTGKKGSVELSDSFEVHILPAPEPIIQGKHVFDNDDEFYISVKQNFSLYKWDTGEETKFLHITKPGTYGVTVTDENGCVGYEEFVIIALLEIDGADFCEGDTVELLATSGYDRYVWSTGDTTESIYVNTGGKYFVSAKFLGEEYSNSFDVTMFPLPTPIIEGDLILLETEEGDIYVQQDFISYLWDSGEDTKSIHITKPGYYGVTVTDENGCTGYAKIEIKSTCNDVYAYADFKTSEHLDFVGKAQKRDSVIHLTRSMLKESGGIWIDDKVNVADGFTASFAFRLIDGHDASIPEASPEGADGIAFVIQNSEKNALGRIASAMGYAGIKNSIAIEYDTFCNDDLQITSNNDPNGSHVAIQSAGFDMNTQVHGEDVTLAMADDIPEFVADARKYYSKIEYDPTESRIKVYIDTVPELITPVIVKEDFNLSELLDLEFGKQAWIGLTAATGDGRQIHELVDLYICLYGPTVGVDENIQYSNNNDIHWNPNPAAEAASLAFNMKYAAEVELSIFDISGQKLTTIISEFREPGQYRQLFDMSGLTPGVYISILKIGSERIVNKIIKTY